MTSLQNGDSPSPSSQTNAVALGPAGPFPTTPLRRTLERRWLHYTFLSPDQQLAMIANISWLGPLPERSSTPNISVLLLIYQRDRGWQTSPFNAQLASQPWSAFGLPQETDLPPALSLSSTTGTPFVTLHLQRSSHPCANQCDAATQLQQYLQWQAEPGIWARGDWGVDGHTYQNVTAIGCHERGSGYWSWSTVGSWISGWADTLAQTGAGSSNLAFYFVLRHPHEGRGDARGTLILWHNGQIKQQFPRRNLTVMAQGCLDRGQVCQVPRLTQLLDMPSARLVPQHIRLSARLGDDHLKINFTATTAARIVVPNEAKLTSFSIHEVIGHCQMEGQVGNLRFSAEASAIFRFAGGDHDD